MSNINISNLSFKYPDSSDNIFNNLNLDLDSSWKLGLVGRNGRGKTTFLNLLRGNLRGTGKIQAKLDFNYLQIKFIVLTYKFITFIIHNKLTNPNNIYPFN